MNKYHVIILIFLLFTPLSSFQYNTYAQLSEQNTNIIERSGTGFNNTNAAYYGIQAGNYKLFVVAGSDTDKYTVNIVLIHKGAEFFIYDNGLTPIYSEFITVISYAGLLIKTDAGQNRTVDFAKLNWEISTSKNRIDKNNAQLNVTITSTVENHPDFRLNGMDISFNYRLDIASLKENVTLTAYDLNSEKQESVTRVADVIRAKIKIDNHISDDQLGQYKAVLLGFNLDYLYRTVIPREFSLGERYNSSEFNNGININSSYLQSSFEWVKSAFIDDIEQDIVVGKFPVAKGIRTVPVNRTSKLVSARINTFNFFGYPAGKNIYHDPLFSSKSIVIPDYLNNNQNNFDKTVQFGSQLIALVILTITIVIYRKKV